MTFAEEIYAAMIDIAQAQKIDISSNINYRYLLEEALKQTGLKADFEIEEEMIWGDILRLLDS